jgi:hypothetical protein
MECDGAPVGRGTLGCEALNLGSVERRSMKQLIVRGDPGIRKGAVIEHAGEEYVCFGISRQGEWHGPEEVQLWCTVGTEDERETFERREYIPMRLETDAADAEEITVIEAKGDPAAV